MEAHRKVHNSTTHSLNECREFRRKPLAERKLLLKEHKICFKCGETNSHMAKECKAIIKCKQCGSKQHPTGLHQTNESERKDFSHSEMIPHGGEQVQSVTTKCTAVCGQGIGGRSCAKTLLVNVFPAEQPEKAITVYAVIDDQSNRTLISPELLDQLGVQGEDYCYTISSCTGTAQASGRKADGLVVSSIDGFSSHLLPSTIECDDIPQDRSEAATPEVVLHHLKELKDHIPKFRSDCHIGLLIGRDLPEAHQVQRQIVGPRRAPFAQKLSLGWVVIGEVCLGKVHPPSTVKVMKTAIINSRGSIFQPCDFNLYTKESSENDHIFVKTKDDEKVSLSVEDRQFLDVMNEECHKDTEGFWTAPLPFRYPKSRMPNNRPVAWKRAMILDASLKKNPTKREHFVSFMQKVLDSKAAEVAPPTTDEVWYLPIFGVYHPKKPDKIRGVFDSSATYKGISLNGTLLSGPNLTNSLLSILLRFRNDLYAVTADVEQMFYRFLVKKEHRDFLRFLWYRNNDPTEELIEYRMRAHVFGNSPSPAVATYALRKAVEDAEKDVKDLVNQDFYVDDCLLSRPTPQLAADVVKRTQLVLKTNGNIRLHKITSNNPEVMNAFHEEDQCQTLKSLNFDKDALPVQHSLGMSWDLNTDSFKFDIQVNTKPETRRGMLSTLNSIFDPIGFLSPITIHGRILFREIATGTGWDEPIPTEQLEKWNVWTRSLEQLKDISIQRMFVPLSLSTSDGVELHIYSDASEKAIATVAYVVTLHDGIYHTGFAAGKSKIAPVRGHTIPRLELCAAVMAVELAEFLCESLHISLQSVRYYSDSKVVLGYVNNKTRRSYTYVANRVERILRSCRADQWSYVNTRENPADLATRSSTKPEDFANSNWLRGPEQLYKNFAITPRKFPLVEPDDDKELRPEVTVASRKTVLEESFIDRLQDLSNWRKLVNVIVLIKRAARRFKGKLTPDSPTESTTHLIKESTAVIIRLIQEHAYHEEVLCLREGKHVPMSSHIRNLDPYLDGSGVLRVGGRLGKSDLPIEETNPIVLPSKHCLTKLLVQHHHKAVYHQGRLITEGSLRNNGYWIVGAKRLITSIISSCVTCRKLRRPLEHQKMSDLPKDRLVPGPPFTSVGVDAFGPWSVVTRKTRGGSANSKRWGMLFTCLTTRAIHVEVTEEMSSSSFINALRRFVAIRGNVKEIRSDCGTNFVGAVNELHIDSVNVGDGPTASYLNDSGIVWKFNAPHSSHMGGVWERMIGVVRRILDSMLMGAAGKSLTHEILVTFMAEVCAIVNSRPVASISHDPKSPEILSPAVLLNQKVNYYDPVTALNFSERDIYKGHWRRVQALSEMFWKKWREGYLQTVQPRRKWQDDQRDLKEGDIVLLRDKSLPRNDWALGIIQTVFKSECDNRVRKAEVRVAKDNRNESSDDEEFDLPDDTCCPLADDNSTGQAALGKRLEIANMLM
ncbi:uncharacterized protein LOC117341342 [Pecten maximus]|uniref:uncharacterized protein LOC117341342 n=1 Tax=Pecten maximus TaxID=6579 RepID=UPI001457E6AD|nr:uncharacterized protein LOC117341342 [Pecten maximus]